MLIQFETADKLFAQRTAAAFGKQGLSGVQFHACLKHLGRFAVLAHAHVAGGDAFDRAVGVIQDFGGGKAGIDFHAEVFRLFGQPAGQQPEADDIVAVVLEAGGNGQFERPLFGEEEYLVFADGAVERCAVFAPVGQQFVQGFRVNDRAGQNVRADLRTFFHDAYTDFPPVFFGQLFQTDGGAQPGRTRADNHGIVLHTFAFDGLFHVCVFLGFIQARLYRRPSEKYVRTACGAGGLAVEEQTVRRFAEFDGRALPVCRQ